MAKDPQNIEGLDSLLRKLRALGGLAQRQAIERALLAGGQLITNEAKVLARKKSGTLARSIHQEVTKRSASHVEVEIGTDVEYAAAHEFGSGLHGTGPGAKRQKYKIAPKNKKMLAWLTQVGSDVATHAPLYQSKTGRLVKSKSRGVLTLARVVWHPGVRPGPFMRPAFDTKKADAVLEVKEALRELIVAALKGR